MVRFLVENRWPFRLHATYNETIHRALTLFEEIDKEIPFNNLHWFFDHAETITDTNLERVKKLNGGIAIQHRMAFQGEYFIQRYGKEAAKRSPPIGRMLAMGIPVGAGTDATRVASYNPWVSLYWMVTGKTVGGTSLYTDENRLERMDALRLYTQGSAQLSREEDKKGTLSIGMYADLAVLSQDYLSVPEETIKEITSYLTLLGGKVVFADAEFSHWDQGKLPVSPDWSPVRHFGGYYQEKFHPSLPHHSCESCHKSSLDHLLGVTGKSHSFNPWSFGCDCFAY